MQFGILKEIEKHLIVDAPKGDEIAASDSNHHGLNDRIWIHAAIDIVTKTDHQRMYGAANARVLLNRVKERPQEIDATVHVSKHVDACAGWNVRRQTNWSRRWSSPQSERE
jgi:hypothetical protein